jgi:hypothetical protein
VLAAAGCTFLLSAPAADAHSVLLSSSPAADAAVAESPAEAVLVVNEPVENRFTELAVLGPDGTSHWAAGPSIVDGRVSAPVRPGAYTIRYRVTSADGHPVSGAIAFRLTVAGPGAAAPAAAMTASPAGAGSMPLRPWISGGAVLLGTGFAVARRPARANAGHPEQAR